MKVIKETKPFKLVQWHLEHLEMKYFENVREIHQYLKGYKDAEEGINDLVEKEGFWINNFMNFSLVRFHANEESDLNKRIDLSESYVDCIVRIQESNNDGFNLYFRLLIEYAENH